MATRPPAGPRTRTRRRSVCQSDWAGAGRSFVSTRCPDRADLARSLRSALLFGVGREGRVFGRPPHLKGWKRRAERQSRPTQLRPRSYPSPSASCVRLDFAAAEELPVPSALALRSLRSGPEARSSEWTGREGSSERTGREGISRRE